MLARGAGLTALESHLSTEREHFWQQEFEISLTAPKLSLVGFSAGYKDAILSSERLRCGFSAEVRKLLHCVGKAQLRERSWSRAVEELQIIMVHSCWLWSRARDHPGAVPASRPQSVQKWTIQLLICWGIPHAVPSGFGEGGREWMGNGIKEKSPIVSWRSTPLRF